MKIYKTFKDLIINGDEPTRADFGAYLKHLRQVSRSTVVEAEAGTGLKERTLYRLFRGERVSNENAAQVDALIAYFRQYVEDTSGTKNASEMDRFRAWQKEYRPIPSEHGEGGGAEKQSADPSTIPKTILPERVKKQGRGILAGLALCTALVLGIDIFLDHQTSAPEVDAENTNGVAVSELELPPRPKNPKIIGEINLNARVRYQDDHLLITNVSVSGIRRPFDIFYQNNDNEFISFDDNIVWNRPLYLDFPSKLIWSIRDNRFGNEIASIDQSEWLDSEILKFVKYYDDKMKIEDIIADELRCDISGCSLSHSPKILCSGLVENADLIFGNSRFPIKEPLCQPSQTDRTNGCLSTHRIDIPLRVENPPMLEVRFAGGKVETATLPLPVTSRLWGEYLNSNTFRGERVYDLPTHRAEDRDDPFSVVATFSSDGVTQTHFIIAIGIDKCMPPRKGNPPILYLNINGEGFFQAGVANTSVGELWIYAYQGKDAPLRLDALQQWHLPADEPSIIEVGVGTLAGIETILGSFDFDPNQIARRALADSLPPVIVCRGAKRAPAGLSMLPGVRCVPLKRLAMVNVSEVRFRENREGKIIRIPIDFSLNDYINTGCQYTLNNNECPPLIFQTPSYWVTIQSQFALKDGTTTQWLNHSYR